MKRSEPKNITEIVILIEMQLKEAELLSTMYLYFRRIFHLEILYSF